MSVQDQAGIQKLHNVKRDIGDISEKHVALVIGDAVVPFYRLPL